MPKSILTLLIRRANWLLGSNGIHNTRRAANVQYFHHRIVQTVVGGKKIRVACDKDEKEEFVCAETNARGIFGNAKTEEEDEDGEDVGHVPAETEDVH
jgi:hypothetical protein